MTGFLLDTNIVSELIKPRPEPKVSNWISSTEEDLLFLSVLTIGEIRKGIGGIADAARARKLEWWLRNELVTRFEGRILPVDIAVAERWGRLAAMVRRPLPVIDGLLAATAQQHDLVFVSRNTDDVEGTGVPIFNPWRA